MSEPPQSSRPQGADWTEQQLPPVKPPTTALLMQLFFIPMIIVSIIVAVWLLFGWLAQSGRNPDQLAANLKQLNKGSWQDAHSLSKMLQDPRQQALRQNEDLAASLAETLSTQLTKDLRLDGERQKLALWLCRALGYFEVDTGVPSLLNALENEDFEVRCAAAEGIATLAQALGDQLREADPTIVTRLQEPVTARAESASREAEIAYGELRGSVAYALGVVGGSEACDTLSLVLSDPYPEARYNAATGLARNGDVRAVPRLCEMLTLDNAEAVRYENESESLRAWKQNLVIINGLRAVRELYTVNEAAPVDATIRQAVDTISASGRLGVRDGAKYALDEVVRFLDERAK